MPSLWPFCVYSIMSGLLLWAMPSLWPFRVYSIMSGLLLWAMPSLWPFCVYSFMSGLLLWAMPSLWPFCVYSIMSELLLWVMPSLWWFRVYSIIRTYGQGQPYMPPLCGGIKSKSLSRLVGCCYSIKMVCCTLVPGHARKLPMNFYWIWPGTFREEVC